jgi:hypothetical protein
MTNPSLDQAPTIKPFGARFEQPAVRESQRPLGSTQIGNDDTGTWRSDTQEADT